MPAPAPARASDPDGGWTGIQALYSLDAVASLDLALHPRDLRAAAVRAEEIGLDRV